MELWEILKRETPTCVDEINLALQNCIDTIENTRALLQDKSIKYMNLEKNQEAIELIKVRTKLLDVKSYLEGVKCGDTLALDIPQKTSMEETQINTTTMPIEEPNEEEIDEDEKYLVDSTIPYKLSEDFMNTKPCAFELQGVKYEVKSFYEVLIKFCEVLYRKNQRLFEKIAGEHKIRCGENGKVMICFEQDKVASELPKNKCTPILSSDILVYTNTNTPTKVYAIRELLSIYHISEKSFSIYLRWDKRITKGQRPVGKFLNMDYDYSQESASQPKAKPEIGVGQLAYDFFKEYFKDTQKQYDLRNFLDENWCMDVLGIACPLFKEFDTNKNIKEQTMWGGKTYPSYAQNPKYQINGKIYLICMRWYEQYRDKLETWIKERDNTYLERVYSKKINNGDNVSDTEDDHISKSDAEKKIEEDTLKGATEFKQQRLFPKTYKRYKMDCIHYDFKKDQCLCTQSNATFTMPCSNINSCQHFAQFALHIVPKQYCKRRSCPYCNGSLEKELVYCTYRPDDETEIHNKLISYRCEKCDINYVADTVYKGYTRSKNLDDLNVTFIEALV